MTINPFSSRANPSASAFGARHFAAVWVSGMLWNLTRWGVAFLGTFLINDMTGSPRLVQLAGTTLYAPLLVGGVLGGLVSDRIDRLRTVRIQLIILIPFSIAIGLLVNAGLAEVWMIYIYMFVVGIGWVTDMTSRRALVFDIVGQRRLDHAMAMESISLSTGMILGALVGGSAVEAVGIGSAYFFIAGLLAAAVLVLATVTSPPQTKTAADVRTGASALAEIREGFQILRTLPGLLGLLGVTVIANFFLFAYFPIVPVVADRLGATPGLVGLLSAGTGIGMMLGSIGFAKAAPRRRGAVHVLGLFIALTFIVPFGLAGRYWLALAALVCSGIGSGLFAATQTSLVMSAAPDALRGRALGLLSMAIGALPVGMYVLGEFAEQASVKVALTATATAGIIVLGSWVILRREVLRMGLVESANKSETAGDVPVPSIANGDQGEGL